MKSLRSRFLLSTFALFLCVAVPTQAADIVITPASVVASGAADDDTSFAVGVAGATILAGQPVYLDTSVTPNKYKLADANGASPLYKFAGIALHGASDGQPIKICTQDNSFTLGGTVAAGAVVVLSATAGGLCVVDTTVPQPTTGWFVTVVGVGIGSNKIKFAPIRADIVAP